MAEPLFSPSATLNRPLASASDTRFANADLETGAEDEPRWASWARQAAERVRQKAAETADQAQRAAAEGLERAKSVDWSEQAEQVRTNVSSSFEVVKESVTHGVERAKSVEWDEKMKGLQRGLSTSFENVSTGASAASSALQERGQAGLEVTREYSRASVESLHLTETFTKAKDGVSAAAGATTGVLSQVGERARGSLTVLTISPTTWAQFAGMFLFGTLFIMLSLNFLPILIIAPHKFAMSFTIGSVTMLSSFVIFSGPKAFLTSMAQREKLPFSIAYGVGLLGTLWATLIMRSYIFTAVFALLQAVSLLYFVASYLPGGKAAVTACCRFSGRSVRALVRM